MPLPPGTPLGPHEFRELFGKDGMGEVNRARPAARSRRGGEGHLRRDRGDSSLEIIAAVFKDEIDPLADGVPPELGRRKLGG